MIEVGSRVDENAYRLDVTVPSGEHECGLAESIERVDILSQIEKASKGGCITPLRGLLPVTLQRYAIQLEKAFRMRSMARSTFSRELKAEMRM